MENDRYTEDSFNKLESLGVKEVNVVSPLLLG